MAGSQLNSLAGLKRLRFFDRRFYTYFAIRLLVSENDQIR